MKTSVLIIYTGGTIGMKEDPADGTLKPFDFSGILEEVPELRKFAMKIDASIEDRKFIRRHIADEYLQRHRQLAG